MSGPFVDYSIPYDPETGEDGVPDWYVAIEHEGEIYLITRPNNVVRFLRKQDATAACNALVAAGLGTFDAIAEAGMERTRKVMCEALAW